MLDQILPEKFITQRKTSVYHGQGHRQWHLALKPKRNAEKHNIPHSHANSFGITPKPRI